MKQFATILALYISVLILTPCFDNENHKDEASFNIEHVFDGTHSELCSPFCSNHECHTHITFSFINTDLVQEQFCDIMDVDAPASIPTPFFAIWQPPKIG